MNPARRTLSFAAIDQIMPEVDRLLEGHATVGNWSLGQIFGHLTHAVTYSVDGFPQRAPWLIRKTIGPWLLRRILRSGQFPEGVKLPKEAEPRPGLDARAEAEAMRAALRIFATAPGPFAEHPLGPAMDRAGWERMHCIHCAHHLSYVLPTSAR
jgi:hypothetical protein